MYDNNITGMNYKSSEKVRSVIHWDKIRQKYQLKHAKFKTEMRYLKRKGLVDDDGKSGAVYSLTITGLSMARNYLDLQ
jgi:hypothetical protein